MIKESLTALWEASDRVCGKRLKVMIPILLPALEHYGRLKLSKVDRDLVLAISSATIDRLLGDVKVAASGGKRRRAGFYSAIRREVPIRTFNDWNGPPPGYCEVDMVAHGGTSVVGSFIQTLTMVDIATGWTECLPLVTRDGSLVVEAMKHRARPAHRPSRRACRKSYGAWPISRHRSANSTIWVTFADEAIRGVKVGRRLTLPFLQPLVRLPL